MAVKNPFSGVDRPPKIRRSAFDLSYEIKTTMEMGHLYPVMFDEVVPGDVISIGCSDVIRCNPLIAPVMHEINAYVHYFFVPYRILDPYWEQFITGGRTGTAGLGGRDSTSLVKWPVNALKINESPVAISLADYMGFPMDVIRSKTLEELEFRFNDETYLSWPIDYPRRAYYSIYLNYYWDENLDPEYSWIKTDGISIDWGQLDLGIVMQRGWAKDYFVSALPSRQRGIAPAVGGGGSSGPVSTTFTINLEDLEVSADTSGDPTDPNPVPGSIPIWFHSVPTNNLTWTQEYDGAGNRDSWDNTNPRSFPPAFMAWDSATASFEPGHPFYYISGTGPTPVSASMPSRYNVGSNFYGVRASYDAAAASQTLASTNFFTGKPYNSTPRPPGYGFGHYFIPPGSPLGKVNAGTYTGDIELDLTGSGAITAADIRLMTQIDKWQQRNMRSGYRYVEFLRAHYGVWPRDERLQRPEYIGGAKFPVVVSEVLQTSASLSDGSPQGNMAGHGLAVNGRYCGKYRVHEFGIVMGIMSIMPVPAYEDGLARQWIKSTHFDFYSPEFAHVDDQGISNSELRWTVDPQDDEIFGFQGRWDELRHKQNLVTGKMRLSTPEGGFGFWHLGFHDSDMTNPVGLNGFLLHHDFSPDDPNGVKRIFAVPSEPAFLVSHCNHVKAVRPLPAHARPELVDHN